MKEKLLETLKQNRKALEEKEGTFFDIQRFSIHDGPGIRTLVFLKGCGLRCLWCSNPESQIMEDQVKFNSMKCVGCGMCQAACPEGAIFQNSSDGKFYTDRLLCTGCGECAKVCVYDARLMVNRKATAKEIIETVKRDKPFYGDSGGGVTVGGGDPIIQGDFAYAILALAKLNGLNTAIETSAYGKTENLLRFATVCDNMFVDIKTADDQLHQALTGQSNKLILNNIRKLDQFISEEKLDTKVVFRTPLIPGENAEAEEIIRIGKFVKSLEGDYKIEILPFHNFGEGKYKELGMFSEYNYSGYVNMPREEAYPYKELLDNMGIKTTLGGKIKK